MLTPQSTTCQIIDKQTFYHLKIVYYGETQIDGVSPKDSQIRVCVTNNERISHSVRVLPLVDHFNVVHITSFMEK